MNDHSDEADALGQSDDARDDALSENVRAFLARAQRSHQVPDPEVKQRVRAAVGVALIAAPLGAAPAALHELGAATKLAARWGLGAKLGAAAVVATLAGTGGWLLPHAHDAWAGRATRSGSVPAAPVEAESASTSELDTSKADLSRERAALAPVVAAPPAPSADPAAAEGVVDRSELSLLMAASDALETREAERALVLLAQHRERFPDSALEQERAGLGLVARCLRAGDQDARLGQEASTFLRRFPGAVLTARIRRACGL